MHDIGSAPFPESRAKPGDPLTIYRGLSGPPGPKPRKSPKKVSRKSLKSLEIVLDKVPKRLSETFSRLLGVPETLYRIFRGLGPEIRETAVNGQRVPNANNIPPENNVGPNHSMTLPQWQPQNQQIHPIETNMQLQLQPHRQDKLQEGLGQGLPAKP